MQQEFKLEISSVLENLPMMRAKLREYLEGKRVESKSILKLLSITDELVTNVIEHGYRYQKGIVMIEAREENDIIYMSVEDNGVGFDETKRSKEEGGMGLFLAGKLSDELRILKKDRGTRVEIVKRISKEDL